MNLTDREAELIQAFRQEANIHNSALSLAMVEVASVHDRVRLAETPASWQEKFGLVGEQIGEALMRLRKE